MPGPVFLWYIPYRKLTLYFTLHAPDGYFTLHAPDGQSLTILPKPEYNRNAAEIPSPPKYSRNTPPHPLHPIHKHSSSPLSTQKKFGPELTSGPNFSLQPKA